MFTSGVRKVKVLAAGAFDPFDVRLRHGHRHLRRLTHPKLEAWVEVPSLMGQWG